MPFSSLFQPALALSQFKSQLAEEGFSSTLLNLNFEFARRIGFRAYEPLEKLHAIDMRIGEWFFAGEAWAMDFGPDSREFSELCRNGLGALGNHGPSPEWMDDVRSRIVPEFLKDMAGRIINIKPKIVAFSCTFFQTIPALALARWIKEKDPAVTTLFGGACFHEEMGVEIIAKAPWVDVVSTGEADAVIIPVVRAVLDQKKPHGLAGILFRDDNGKVQGDIPAQVTDTEIFENLPVPDFTEFMTDIDAFSKSEPIFSNAPVFLPFESSRGCWWGEKSQCTFCGLNSCNMTYRSKSPEKTLDLLTVLAGRYPVKRFFATDNNMPLRYYKDFLPELARTPALKNAVLFYEIKTSICRKWMKSLSDAGVKYIQPGIETLSTHILKCMRKGVTVLQNVHLLKLCRIFGITPAWNFLIRIPGERAEDYEAMSALIPKIIHFHPPTGYVRMVQLHRFSPYFREKGQPVTHVTAQAWYAGLFPETQVDLSRVAYYFDAEWQNTVGSTLEDYAGFISRISDWVQTWCNFLHLPALFYDVMQTGPLDLTDTRFGKTGYWRLDEKESWVLRLIDEPASIRKIIRKGAERGYTPQEIETVLENFTDHGLALEDSGIYLGLALPDIISPISLKHRREMFRRYGQCQ